MSTTTTTTTYSVSALAAEIVRTSTLVSPDEVADEIVKRTSPDELERFYRSAVREVARQALKNTRHMYTPAKQKQKFIPSANVKGVRDWWKRVCSERVEAQGTWKMLGDCTIPDLEYLATERRRAAELNTATAKKFDDLAKRVRDANVTTVAQLPASARESLRDVE